LSYTFGFVLDVMGVFFSAATFYYVAKLFGGAAATRPEGVRAGINFPFVLIGIAFSTYQSVA